jgi:hypothetical protein
LREILVEVIENVLAISEIGMIETDATVDEIADAYTGTYDVDHDADDEEVGRGSGRGSGSGSGSAISSDPNKFINWRKRSVDALISGTTTLETSKSLSEQRSTEQKNREGSIRDAYHAISALSACYQTADQMLQLRFQSHGLTFFEGLGKHYTSTSDNDDDEDSPRTTSATTSGVADESSSSDYVDPTTEPPALYEVGQVLRHKTFG